VASLLLKYLKGIASDKKGLPYPQHEEVDRNDDAARHEEIIRTVGEALPGPDYLHWLRWFHTQLRPGNYLEIGVESGQSLQFANSPTRAVGVDPALRVVHSQQTWVKLFGETSDDFFGSHTLDEVFGAEPVDLAFIDGLHTFDQALRDFIHIERWSSPNTVVLFHDILPVVPVTAERERETIFWIGDTWKAILTIARRRQDIRFFTIPTYPSGLTVVTGLNASSRRLSDDFPDILAEAEEMDLEEQMPNLAQLFKVCPNEEHAVRQLLMR
jgi:predicted O-methyltransferase YrrM